MGRSGSAAVADGVLRHFSVSQIRDYRRCPALWAAQKLFHFPTEPGKGQARGTRLHGVMEAYYRDGVAPEHDAIVAALPGLPARTPALLIEEALDDPTLYVDDVRLEGYSDLRVPPELNDGRPAIYDWKFVGSFRYTEEPTTDPQCLIYAYHAFVKWPAAAEVDVALVYFLAEGADFRVRRGRVTRAAATEHWLSEVAPTVREMRALAAAQPAFPDVPKNLADDYQACKKYGGCSFKSKCGTDLEIAAGSLRAREESAMLRKVVAAFDSGLCEK